MATPAASPVKPAEGDRVEQMSVMRKKIAEHMVQSRRTSAHVTTVYDIDMTRIAKLRELALQLCVHLAVGCLNDGT